MELSKLIDGLSIVSISGSLNINITGINHDSRKITKGNIFIAIEGFRVDGHLFIQEAITRGAVAVVTNKKINLESNVTLIEVEDTRVALAYISSKYYDNPSEKIELIGVTGTNGKTTVTYLIKSIFEEIKRKTAIIGTIGSIIDDVLTNSENTTPESLELQKKLYSIVKSNQDCCVMEVSSHSLELKRVAMCKYNVGIFTNLTIDHLDYHKTVENYYRAKIKLFYMTDRCNIINADDNYGRKIAEEVSNLNIPIITYGIENEADIYADEIEYFADGVRFILYTPNASTEIRMKIPGHFTVYNAMAAAACAYAYNIDISDIRKGLENIQGVKGRMEIVPTNREFTVMIDFAHTADALEKLLKTVDQFAKGRKIIVFGAGGDRDISRRAPMGKIAGTYCDLCVVTSDNPRTEDPQLIIDDIIKGIESVKGNYISIVDREEAIKYAIENSLPNDIILLTGKGHETYTILGNKKYHFDEREIVKKVLQTLNKEKEY